MYKRNDHIIHSMNKANRRLYLSNLLLNPISKNYRVSHFVHVLT